MIKRRLITSLLCLSLFGGLLPASITVNAKDQVTRVIACSDFQAKSGHEESQENVRAILSAMEEDEIISADGFICAGDYDYSEDTTVATTKEGMNALQERELEVRIIFYA